MNPKYNFDQDVYEYVDFVMKGLNYKLRLLNTEELQEYGRLVKSGNEQEVESYLYSFIESVDHNIPFVETAKKLLPVQLSKFTEMIYAELTGKSNKSTETK